MSFGVLLIFSSIQNGNERASRNHPKDEPTGFECFGSAAVAAPAGTRTTPARTSAAPGHTRTTHSAGRRHAPRGSARSRDNAFASVPRCRDYAPSLVAQPFANGRRIAKAMPEVAINPPAHVFGRKNAILNARGTRHHESEFAGPLSIKSVVRGSATWETRDGRYELMPGSVLLLNDGEEYSITVDALQPVETFCVFFERGFVEDAFRATITRSAELLDDPDRASA